MDNKNKHIEIKVKEMQGEWSGKIKIETVLEKKKIVEERLVQVVSDGTKRRKIIPEVVVDLIFKYYFCMMDGIMLSVNAIEKLKCFDDHCKRWTCCSYFLISIGSLPLLHEIIQRKHVKNLLIHTGIFADKEVDEILQIYSSIGELLKVGSFLENLTVGIGDCYINDSNLEIEGVAIIGKMLEANDKLETLRLFANGNTINVAPIGKMLGINRTLRSLEIGCYSLMSHNQLTAGCIEIFNSLKTNQSLQSLSLQKFSFPPEDCVAIGEMLKRNKTLKHLEVYDNRPLLGSAGLVTIIQGLECNKSLKTLELIANTGVIDGGALSKALQTNETLENLILSNNHLGTEACVHIMASATSVRCLDLSGNDICPQGALLIAQLLKINQRLERLTLVSNKINVRGLFDIIDALKENDSLKFLNLAENVDVNYDLIEPVLEQIIPELSKNGRHIEWRDGDNF